jgi:hypothetical protein
MNPNGDTICRKGCMGGSACHYAPTRTDTPQLPDSKRVLSVDVMVGGVVRANFADNTWEQYDINPATAWLVEQVEQARDKLRTASSEKAPTENNLRAWFDEWCGPLPKKAIDEFNSLVSK